MRPREGRDGAYEMGVPRLWLSVWRMLDRRAKAMLGIAFVAMGGSAILRAAIPLLIGLLVDRTISTGSIGFSDIWPYLGAIGLLVVTQQLLEVVRRQLVENVGTALERDNRTRVCRHMLRVDLDQLHGTRVGMLYGRANRSIEGTTKLLKLGAIDLLPAVVTAVAALAVALAKSLEVGLVMAMVVPTSFAIVRLQVRSQAGIRVEVRDHKDEIDGQIVELLPLLDSVRAAGAQGYFTERVGAACDRLRATELRHHRAMSLFDAGKFLNEGFWLLAVLWAALGVSGSAGSAGDVTTYALLFTGVLMPLRELHRIIDETSESSLQARDLLDLLSEPEDEGFARAGGGELPRLPAAAAPAVQLDGLRYTHQGAELPVLDGIDLVVGRGERVGIVGRSGCGKSTLLQVLRRFHHGFDGSVWLFGEPLRELDHELLAEWIGYVPQFPHILRDTVAGNIAFGHSACRAEIEAAARRAQIHDDVVVLREGYETGIGERGSTLSGGQRQRICIARSLLREPDLLLLDEPTSSLDSMAERGVQAAIDSLSGVTVLMVAHRLRTLQNFDRIVVLKDGAISEEGSFHQLAVGGGMFEQMLHEQEADRRDHPLAA